jgi:dienelactone hydrolase
MRRSRRFGLLTLAAVVAGAVGTTVAASYPGASASQISLSAAPQPTSALPARLALPAPTGRYQVGTVPLHLIDRSRGNPFAASPSHRELMVSIWYPASGANRYPLAPYMLPGAATHFGSADGAGSMLYRVPPGTVDWAAIRSSGHQGAPVAEHRRPFPVVLFQPDVQDPRTWETTLVQDLASRGYVVVTIDPTYNASEVEFPGGRIVSSLVSQWVSLPSADFLTLAKTIIIPQQVADARFVLDQLAAVNAGRSPDAQHRQLPSGLTGALATDHVGMFGVSFGGSIAAQAMYEDHRISAGVDLDGDIEAPFIKNNTDDLVPALSHGLDRPFMFMANPGTDINTIPSWRTFWDRSTGWHRDLTLVGASGSNSYKDLVPLAPQIARQFGLPQSFVTQNIGTMDPTRAVTGEEAYLSSFFDRWLLGRDNHLLDNPSPRYPEFIFVG